DNEREAIALMVKHPALIKRPILVFHEKVSVGFKPESYAALFDCG
ncbi:MAG: arsenate reductase, partial [Acetobacter sp.]|nr:arsenate reductase [Acetobacter sp.]